MNNYEMEAETEGITTDCAYQLESQIREWEKQLNQLEKEITQDGQQPTTKRLNEIKRLSIISIRAQAATNTLRGIWE